MSETQETNELLREIRDLLLEQAQDHKDYQTKMEELWKGTEAQQAERWNASDVQQRNAWKSFMYANKLHAIVLGIWVFLIVLIAVLVRV